jgi:hypothetical protein
MGIFDGLKKAVNNVAGGVKKEHSQFNREFSTEETKKRTEQTEQKPSAQLEIPCNTNSLYSEKLDKIIEFALADSVLTDKEKQVLFKQAEADEIDLDEFEMVLEARVHERQQENKLSVSSDIDTPQSTKIDVKSIVVRNIVNIDYDTVLIGLNLCKVLVPSSVTHGIRLIKSASILYKESDSENREDDFVNYLTDNLDAEYILNDIKPIVKMIPFGGLIMLLIKYIIKRQKHKKSCK